MVDKNGKRLEIGAVVRVPLRDSVTRKHLYGTITALVDAHTAVVFINLGDGLHWRFQDSELETQPLTD